MTFLTTGVSSILPLVDQKEISPYTINTLSSRTVTRGNKIITKWMFYDLKSTSQSLNYRNGWQTVQRINIYIRSKQYEKFETKLFIDKKEKMSFVCAMPKQDVIGIRSENSWSLRSIWPFLYFWCHFTHSWYNVEENIWLVKRRTNTT